MSISEASNNHIVVFALHGCGPCQDLKDYIDQRDVKCEIIHVGEDISTEVFKRIYPEAEGFPYSTVNGIYVGNLMYYLESGL